MTDLVSLPAGPRHGSALAAGCGPRPPRHEIPTRVALTVPPALTRAPMSRASSPRRDEKSPRNVR